MRPLTNDQEAILKSLATDSGHSRDVQFKTLEQMKRDGFVTLSLVEEVDLGQWLRVEYELHITKRGRKAVEIHEAFKLTEGLGR